jgi:hypothetical protein
MSGRQGFITNGQTFVYQNSPADTSAAFGIDGNDSNKWKLQVKLDSTALPSGSTQFVIDPAANGNILFTPNGAGQVGITTLGVGALISSATGLLSSSGAGVAGQVLMSNGPGVAPTFQNSEDVSWQSVAGTTISLVPNKGYILQAGTLTTATLPLVCPAGDVIRICGSGTGLFLIAQNTGQSIKLGTTSSTGGATGSVASSNQYDAIELLCVVANTMFATISSVGNFTVS